MKSFLVLAALMAISHVAQAQLVNSSVDPSSNLDNPAQITVDDQGLTVEDFGHGAPGGGGFHPAPAPHPIGGGGGGFHPPAPAPHPIGGGGGGFHPPAPAPHPIGGGGGGFHPPAPAPHPIGGGGGFHPGPGHPGGGFGPHPIGGGFGPHPVGWHYNPGWRPAWWHVGVIFPAFFFDEAVPVGYVQCTAFNEAMEAFTEDGVDDDTASYNALYACGGDNYEAVGCYIPEGYCQVR